MNFTSELHKISSGRKKTERRITYAEDVAYMVDIKSQTKFQLQNLKEIYIYIYII